MFKYIWRWSLIILLLALFATLPAAAQNKSVVWNRFDVDITINADGSFDVVEKQEIQFMGGPFTFGYRDISTKNTEAITDIQVGDVNGAYEQDNSEAPGTFHIEDRGSSIYVKWFFDKTTNAARTFFISYRVIGGLRYYNDGDQLWWKAVYADRPAEVKSSVVTVKAPPAATIENMDAYFAKADMQLLDKQTAQFTAKEPIPPGQPLEVRVQFTHGVVAGTAAAWQAKAEQEQTTSRWRTVINIFVMMLALMLFFLAPVALYLLWYKWGRDPNPQIAPEYLPEPPSNLPPGMVGALVDEKADTRDVLASIVDMARRGYLHIEELDEDDDSGYSSRDFLYTKLREPDDDLREYEAYLLKKLFNKEHDRKLSELKNSFYKYNEEAKTKIYEELVKEGYFVANPANVRSKWLGIGVGLIILNFIFACVLTPILTAFTDVAILLTVGPGIFAIGLIVISRIMPKKTQAGADEAAKWKAFRTYLKEIKRYTDLEKATTLFDRYLPYAIAFGFEKHFLQLWEPVENIPAPGWYGPYYAPRPGYGGTRPPGNASPAAPEQSGGTPSLGDASSSMSRSFAGMSTGLASMLSVASSTLTSRPQSSSGSGSITAPERICAPISEAFSMMQTLRSDSSCFRRIAHARPAGPAPTTITSYSITSRSLMFAPCQRFTGDSVRFPCRIYQCSERFLSYLIISEFLTECGLATPLELIQTLV